MFSYPMFRDLERVQKVFTGIAAHRLFGANLAFEGQTMSGSGMLVSGSYFPVLGFQPVLGRLLGPGDDRTVGESLVVVLAHAYWADPFRRATGRPQQDDRGQWPVYDHRRRRARAGSTGRRWDRSPRSSSRSHCAS